MSQPWQTDFINSLPFASLLPVSQKFNRYSDWPAIEIYNQLAMMKKLTSKSEKSITFVEQTAKSRDFNDQYEPKIYLNGEIQTRKNNWHDFFNAMSWLTFPKTKAALNELQYLALKERLDKSKIRTPLENILTLFDENGAVVISSSQKLLDLLKNFQWKELFWGSREAVMSQMQFFIFGHSLYEKALNPYIGMTASSLIFLVNNDFLAKDLSLQIKFIDTLLTDFFTNIEIKAVQKFMPLPILGIPGWNVANNNAGYYNNIAYFRPRKKLT